MSKLPKIRISQREWRERSGGRTPGVGIFQGDTLRAHLTPGEAVDLANKLVDLAELIEAKDHAK